ncbi:MAG: hypothetical protein RJA22_1330 [Verrucomicrobiota bacterium]|jgi:hypothetical protein
MAGLLAVWLVAGTAYYLSNRAKVTAEKVADYLRATDLQTLQGEARARALDRLARQMTALPMEERRRARMDEAWDRWFAAMTDAEKGSFIEATMPSGVRQMLASFEEMPEDKRRRAVSDALRDLRRAREAEAGEGGALRVDTNRPPPLSDELQQRVVAIGLKTFYAESSAQTKAELAPVLEEMQRLMESGRLFRGERR